MGTAFMMRKPTCAASVGGGLRAYPCSRYGVVERAGKWYCVQHDPEVVAARRYEHMNKISEIQTRNDQAREEATRMAARVNALGLGAAAEPYYHRSYSNASGASGYRRAVVIPLDVLDTLLRKWESGQAQ